MAESKRNFLSELLFALFVISLIITFWFYYPNLVLYMDKSNQIVTHRMVIPYKYPQPIEEPKEETKLQKIGEKYGTYGDSYGSLNTLFSGLAFAMLILSLWMQRNELKAQRNEISESNAIAEGQRIITEQQALMIERQINDANVHNFYTTLFKLLEEKQRKISLLEFLFKNKEKIYGENVLQKFSDLVISDINRINYNIDVLKTCDKEVLLIYTKRAIKSVKTQTDDVIHNSQLVGHILFILDFIEKNQHLKITDNAIDIFISYQSVYEMTYLLFESYDNKSLRYYILKYALLRQVRSFEDEYFTTLIYKIVGPKTYCP